MRRVHVLSQPTKNSDIKYSDFYEELSHDWQRKAEQLRIRRWRALMREMKGDQHATNKI